MTNRFADLLLRHAAVLIFTIACVVGLAVAEFHATIDQEYFLDDLRAFILKHNASDQTVLVKMDNYSLDHLGEWPWPRRIHAKVVDRLRNAGAKLVIFDVDFSGTALDPHDDVLFTKSLERSPGLVVLPGPIQPWTNGSNKIVSALPIPTLLRNTSLAYTYENDSDHRVTYERIVAGHLAPALPIFLSGRDNLPTRGNFLIDWSADPASFQNISYYDVLRGRFPNALFRNKIVLIGATAPGMGVNSISPVYGAIPGAEMQLVAGETLRRGIPRPIGQFPLLALAIALVACGCFSRNGVMRIAIYLIGTAVLFAIPLILRWSTPIVIESVAALATMLAAISTQCGFWILGFFNLELRETPDIIFSKPVYPYPHLARRGALKK